MRKRLKDMKNEISEDDLMIHIINTLPEEYETRVQILERIIDNPNNLLSIETLRDELHPEIRKN